MPESIDNREGGGIGNAYTCIYMPCSDVTANARHGSLLGRIKMYTTVSSICRPFLC